MTKRNIVISIFIATVIAGSVLAQPALAPAVVLAQKPRLSLAMAREARH